MSRHLPFHSNAVWPPSLLVIAFVAAYGIIALVIWSIERSVPTLGLAMSRSEEIRNLRTVILAITAGAYAAYRLARFHPVCDRAYANWLRLSPWSAGRPLPLGPVHPVGQDGAVIGALTAIAYWHALDPSWPIMIFGFVYLAGFTVLLAFTRRWRSCFALGLLWPALMLPATHNGIGVAIIAAIVVVIWHGHRQSLRAFPWPFLAESDRPAVSLLQTNINLTLFNGPANAGYRSRGNRGTLAPGTNCNLGWPISALSPKLTLHSISATANLAAATLAGWWCFCIVESSQMDPLPDFILFIALFGVALRMAIYCGGVAPPFNLWGRLRAGRIIVPGFDKVFLTPLAGVLVAMAGGAVIKESGTWYPLAEALVISTALLVLLGGGPTLRNWALMGQFRSCPPKSRSQIRPV